MLEVRRLKELEGGPKRRAFLRCAAGAGVALLSARASRRAGASPEAKVGKADEDEVSVTEDLMREHGILRRILLIYGEVIARLDAKADLKREPIAQTAEIVRAFIEDYHECDEEEFLFPRFQKAAKHVDLVQILLAQHQAGRKLTATISRLATTPGFAGVSDRRQLTEAMRLFIRMYEPHAAREDTVLFPAFRQLVSPKELETLMDVFEDKEKALPGGGFEKMVGAVAKIEEELGIGDLAKFTPRVT